MYTSKSLPSSTSQLFWYFVKCHKLKFALLLFCMFLSGLINAIDGYLTKLVVDKASTHIGYRDVLLFAALFFGWWEVINLLWRAIDYLFAKTIPVIRATITEMMFTYVLGHSFKYFQETMAGSIASKINELAKSMGRIIELVLTEFIRKTFIILSSIIALAFIHHYLALGLLLWMIIFVSLSYVFAKKMEILSNRFAESRNKVVGKIVDSITNIFSIRVFARGTFETNYLSHYLDNSCRDNQTMDMYKLKTNYIKGICNSFLIGAMLLIILSLKAQNKITIGDLSMILAICLGVVMEIWEFTKQISTFSEEIGNCTNSLKSINIPHQITDKLGASILQVPKGEIIFDQVDFHYQGRQNLFGNKSVIIKPREKIGLVGYSGSGKTTFVNLIIRLFDVSSGQILIDGQNIMDVTQDSLRDNIAFIPQDPSLFHRSLRENIRYAKLDASDEEVVEAAKKAHAHDFILNMPEGYDSLVGERGVRISGGQRQRIAIARAILKNSPILILDEATSALDSLTEKEIQSSIADLMHDKTTIVIAHRLSTLLNMDRILVFNRGTVIQDGTHEQLLSERGLYRNMWNAQVHGFLPKRNRF